MHLKLYFQINNEQSLTYNLFYSSAVQSENFEQQQIGTENNITEGAYFKYNNQNLINNIQWEYLITPELKMKNSLALQVLKDSNTISGPDSPDPEGYHQLSDILQYRSDWDYRMSSYNSISFGYFGYFLQGNINMTGYATETKITGAIQTNFHPGNYDGTIVHHSFYLQDELEIIKYDFTISAGLHYDINDLSKNNSLSPRAGLRKKIIPNMYFNFAWGYYYQYPNDLFMLNQQTGNPDLKPEEAVHYLAGFDNYLAKDVLFQNNFFYKNYSDLIITDPVQNYINGAVGYAYGFESMLKKASTGPLNGWLSYTFSVTKQKITIQNAPYDPYNGNNITLNQWYAPDYDQHHTISANINYAMSSHWSLSSSWEFHTGTPYTEITGAVKVVNSAGNTVYLPVKGTFNSQRLPTYHQLNLKLTYAFKIGLFPSELYIQVVNLYDRKNIEYYYYSNDYQTKIAACDLPLMASGGFKINF